MIETSAILKTIITFITGGAAWEGFKFIYPEIKRKISKRTEAHKILYKNLDPILKAADELYGKLESLAKEDFSTFTNPQHSISSNTIHNKKYIYYLFSQFWAQLEFLRLQSQYTDLSQIKAGKQLLRFIETIESRKFRILDRSLQRIIGESLIIHNQQTFRIITLWEFMTRLEEGNSALTTWISHLEKKLEMVKGKETRQQVLKFGVVVAAFINHFDSKSRIVRNRKVYLNKLSIKTKRIIRDVLISSYLPFLKDKKKYF